MNFAIIYFSGTGNTQLICRELQRRLENQQQCVELLSLEDPQAIESLDLTDKILGVFFPVYKFTYPDNFARLFPILEALQQRAGQPLPYFTGCTYTRFSAASLHDFSQRLDPQAFRLIAQASFKCPSNGIASMQASDSYAYQSVMFFEDHISAKLAAFADEVLRKAAASTHPAQTPRGPWLTPLRLKIVADIERTRYPQLQIDPEKCSGCGLCARQCPQHNLSMVAGRVEIADAADCLHCLRCLHHCPTHAISFGDLTQGPQRYTLKTRDRLFERAKTGAETQYWQDFDKIRSRWRRDILRYWLTHRRRR